MRKSRFALAEGDVVVMVPEDLWPDSVEDLDGFWQVFKKGSARSRYQAMKEAAYRGGLDLVSTGRQFRFARCSMSKRVPFNCDLLPCTFEIVVAGLPRTRLGQYRFGAVDFG